MASLWVTCVCVFLLTLICVTLRSRDPFKYFVRHVLYVFVFFCFCIDEKNSLKKCEGFFSYVSKLLHYLQFRSLLIWSFYFLGEWLPISFSSYFHRALMCLGEAYKLEWRDVGWQINVSEKPLCVSSSGWPKLGEIQNNTTDVVRSMNIITMTLCIVTVCISHALRFWCHCYSVLSLATLTIWPATPRDQPAPSGTFDGSNLDVVASSWVDDFVISASPWRSSLKVTVVTTTALQPPTRRWAAFKEWKIKGGVLFWAPSCV